MSNLQILAASCYHHSVSIHPFSQNTQAITFRYSDKKTAICPKPSSDRQTLESRVKLSQNVHPRNLSKRFSITSFRMSYNMKVKKSWKVHNSSVSKRSQRSTPRTSAATWRSQPWSFKIPQATWRQAIFNLLWHLNGLLCLPSIASYYIAVFVASHTYHSSFDITILGLILIWCWKKIRVCQKHLKSTECT